jgi:hypothetical protein
MFCVNFWQHKLMIAYFLRNVLDGLQFLSMWMMIAIFH